MKPRIVALIALLSLLLALPVSTVLANDDVFEGTAVISDDQGLSDAITITMSNVPEPSAGTELVGWLVSDDGNNKLSTGPMALAGGAIAHTFDSSNARYTGENLIHNRSLLVITEEAAGADPDAPAGPAVYHYQIPTSAIVHIRHLVSDWPEGTGVGILTNLQEQLKVARQHADLGRLDGTLDGLKRHAHHVINIIEGEDGANFDVSFGNPGDGLGVLLHADDKKHAGFAAFAVQDDEALNTHAGLVDVTSVNANNFAVLARDRVLQFVLPETNLNIAKSYMANVSGVLTNALSGLDANADGTIALISGEAGAEAAYTEAQLMATYTLQVGSPPTPTPTPTNTPRPTSTPIPPAPTATPIPPAPTSTPDTGPVTGDTSVPALAQLALLLAGVMLIGGGFVFVASRKEEGSV